MSSVNPKWFRGVVLATYFLVSMFGLHVHRISGCAFLECGSPLGHPSVCTHSDHTAANTHEHKGVHSHDGHRHHCGIDRHESPDAKPLSDHQISHPQNGIARTGQNQSGWHSDHSGHCSVCEQLWSLSQYGFAVCEAITTPAYDAVSCSSEVALALPASYRIEPSSRGPPFDLSA